MNLLIDSHFKIAVFGTGISAERFLSSFLFLNAEITLVTRQINEKSKSLACKYNVNLLLDSQVELISNYDILIFSLPIEPKLNLINSILEKSFSSKYFVIEKPFTNNYNEAVKLHNLLISRGINYVVPYTRIFDPQYAKFMDLSLSNYIQIEWYNLVNISIFDGLPHILNYILNLTQKKIYLSDCFYNHGKLESFILKGLSITIEVKIQETLIENNDGLLSENKWIELNGVILPFPNFIQANICMLQYLLQCHDNIEVHHKNNLETVLLTEKISNYKLNIK
ncbi:Gfo/Idh/MocA family oxidoreductase [Paenibacillus sp. A3M_27_13]|uniref:Gfo/Idh/MocA family oxidoreductase n=1 Tax=Paenibacillus sp. A3M_27_13 TaxID=2962029 RepID=UPI0020B8603E|nr:Gfo/Idh/MocA family oxidoreductase [Paenibacillus sp. A3M_27_13]MCP3746812.1 Gfo/Idh/MocA family oxidoreductase [Paenibacillus sp. A3M_27_13]